MCNVIKVSVSGYYKWLHKAASSGALRNQMLWHKITAIYLKSKCRYGSPRITKELNMNGIKVSKVLVAKLMKQDHLRSIVRKKYKVTTNSSHKYTVVENLLNREFTVNTSNRVWVSDITYIATEQGWTYLTTVIDLFDRKVIGWALSNSMYAKTNKYCSIKNATNKPTIKSNTGVSFSFR
jgi:transposase InsO family protein